MEGKLSRLEMLHALKVDGLTILPDWCCCSNGIYREETKNTQKDLPWLGTRKYISYLVSNELDYSHNTSDIPDRRPSCL